MTCEWFVKSIPLGLDMAKGQLASAMAHRRDCPKCRELFNSYWSIMSKAKTEADALLSKAKSSVNK